MRPATLGIVAARSALLLLVTTCTGGPTGTIGLLPVASVTITPAAPTIRVQESLQLTATLRDSVGSDLTGRTVSWTSAAPTIASVSSYGMVTGVAPGMATITAASEGKAATTAIAVTAASAPPVASVAVAPANATIAVGGSVSLGATLRDANGNVLSGRTVTWASGAPATASVSSQGVVTGVAAGTATVTATSEGKTGSASIGVTGTAGAPFAHVLMVVLENHDYASVIGNSSMPYLNSLAQQYASAAQYYADTHPSIGNYFMLTVGDTVTNDDNFSGTVAADNVIRRLLAAHQTWKSYAEDMPYAGYLGSYSGNYARYHNPPALLADVVNDAAQRNNLVPFTQFATDVANNALPNYSLIIPNLCNDAHNCSLGTADHWLQTNIDPLIQNAAFQRDGLLIITFDEAASSSTHGGGQVAWVIVSAKAKRGYQSNTLYQHASTLRLMLRALGVAQFPSRAATAPDMTEFFSVTF